MRFSRFPLGGAARRPAVEGSALARFAAVACMVGLTLAFAWPDAATGQDEPATPVGVYTVSLGEADLPPDLPGAAVLRGQWTLTLNEDGTYTLARQDVGVMVAGTYEIDGATLTLAGWGGLIPCGAGEAASTGEESASASYAWELDGEELTLTPIEDTCQDRRVLLSTRPLGGFQACSVAPLASLVAPGGPGVPPPGVPSPGEAIVDERRAATPVGPGATPEATNGSAVPAGSEVEAAIDVLLQQATGCWAAGDAARFLALHSSEAIAALEAQGPLTELANFLQEQGMMTPISFNRIGEVTLIDPNHAEAYVEVTFGGQRIPQRLAFAREGGVWLFDFLFLFPPPE